MQLSVKDVAHILNVDDKTVYGWIKQENIPVCRVGETFRFNRADILEWATARQMAHAVLESDAPDQLTGLADALKTGGIVYGVKGGDKPAVLRNVVNAMQLADEVDRDFLYDVLLARENLGSTGMGEGIAIPHVRNPIILHVDQPVITLCFLEAPIEFGAIDGKPVDILFTMVSPTVRAHLHLLTRLGFVLRDPEFKTALADRIPETELMDTLTRTEKKIVPQT